MIYLKILITILLIIITCKAYLYLINILQQEHYHVKPFTKVFKTYYLNKIYIISIYVVLSLTIINYLLNIFITHNYVYNDYVYNDYVHNDYVYNLITIFILTLSLFFFDKPLIKLRFTSRIKRHIITSILICIIYLILTNLFIYSKYHLIALTILPILIPLIIILTLYINKPFEKIIQKRYLISATNKLNNNQKVIKIGITGSYGKTTTKNIINQILTDHVYTLATPLSYNTLMGISKTINESMNNNIEVFICEMGTSSIGEIKQITKFIDPNIVIITEIGPQHLESFGSIDNIVKAKQEIIEYSSYNTIVCLNYDNEYIKNIPLTNKKTIYLCSINDNSSYNARNIQINAGVTSFDIYEKDNFIININTLLLGRHNVMNILLAYTVIKALETYQIIITNEQIKEAIYTMEPVLHRLSYHQQGCINIYDDSYNSNFQGFLNAIEVLSKTKGKKIIITPGMVELGTYQKVYHEKVTEELVKVFDEIYLIKNTSSLIIKNKLDELNKEYLMFNHFTDAYQTFISKYQLITDEQINLLIENDLPDNYLERK